MGIFDRLVKRLFGGLKSATDISDATTVDEETLADSSHQYVASEEDSESGQTKEIRDPGSTFSPEEITGREDQIVDVNQRTRGPRVEQHDGATQHITQYPNSEGMPLRFLVVGLDFGTAFTKIVIADKQDSYAVPLREELGGIDTYLLPALIRRGIGSQFELSSTKDVAGIVDNLKLQLLEQPTDLTARANAAAFLALVLRRARRTFMDAHADIFSGHHLVWHLNIGLPAENYGNRALKEAYRVIGQAAWTMSVLNQPITENLARVVVDRVPTGRGMSGDPAKSPLLHPEKVGVIPEVVAETVSYARSPLRSNGLHLLVDVGAGTLDINTFVLHDRDGDDSYGSLISKVLNLGTVFVNRHREQRLMEEGLLTNKNAGGLFSEYLPLRSRTDIARGLGIDVDVLERIDGEYQNLIGNSIWEILSETKRRRDPNAPAWRDGLPCFLAGGGSTEEAYVERLQSISRVMRQNQMAGLLTRSLPRPGNFGMQGVADTHFHRLAVAYGLAHDLFDIGDFIPPDDIEDIVPDPPNDDWGEPFIGPEQM